MAKRVPSEHALDTIIPDLVALRAAKTPGLPVIVPVAGGSGFGKGHLIARLTEALNASGGPPDATAVLTLDDYYIGRERMKSENVPHFDHPSALDLRLAGEHLARMRVAKYVSVPRYDFPTGQRVGEKRFCAKAFVLVDGLFALQHPAILALADYKIFVDSDHYSAMLRRLFRDAGPNGRTKQSSRAVIEQYFKEVWPAKREFIDPTAVNADVIVESRYDAAIEAGRAGPMQYQLKARGTRSDDELTALCGAVRLGAETPQMDVFMAPVMFAITDEMLRLRSEPGALFLTYKGPHSPSTPGARPATSPIELPTEALTWFDDDYHQVTSFLKNRTLFQAEGLIIARDQCLINLVGNFIEVRGTDESQIPMMRQLLERLCPGAPILTQSYLELWKSRPRPEPRLVDIE